MTQKQALSNLMAAITGEDVLKTGLYVGTLKQHTILQESIEVLQSFIMEMEQSGKGAAADGKIEASSPDT